MQRRKTSAAPVGSEPLTPAPDDSGAQLRAMEVYECALEHLLAVRPSKVSLFSAYMEEKEIPLDIARTIYAETLRRLSLAAGASPGSSCICLT